MATGDIRTEEEREEIFQETFFRTPTGRRLRSHAATLNPAAFRNCYLLQTAAQDGDRRFVLLVDAEELIELQLGPAGDEITLISRTPGHDIPSGPAYEKRAGIALRLARRRRAARI